MVTRNERGSLSPYRTTDEPTEKKAATVRDKTTKKRGKIDHSEEAAAWSWLASHSLEERASLLEIVRAFDALSADLRSRLLRVVALAQSDPQGMAALDEAVTQLMGQRDASE